MYLNLITAKLFRFIIIKSCIFFFSPLSADISKEEKEIKNTQNQITCVEKEIAYINRLLNERKELQECLKQAAEISKSDYNQTLKVCKHKSYIVVLMEF